MANQLANIGSNINELKECVDLGYTTETCVVAQGTKETIKYGCVAGASVMLSSGIPQVQIGGVGLALSSEPLGTMAKETILFFSDKQQKNDPVNNSDNFDNFDNFDNSDNSDNTDNSDNSYNSNERVKNEIRFRELKNDIGFTNLDVEYAREELGQLLHKTQNNITLTREQINGELENIHRTSKNTVDIQTRLSKLAKKTNDKVDMLVLNYELMFRKSCKLSPDIVKKYGTDENFKRENNKLEQMILEKNTNSEISIQHERVMLTIKNNDDLTYELNNFTTNINVCGSVGSCIANLCGHTAEAKHINTITSSVIQLSSIAAGFNGLGPLACMGPYGLGAIAVVTILNCAMSLTEEEGTSPFVGLHQMLTSIIESIGELKKSVEEHFKMLNVKLDKMESNIIKHIIDNFDMNYSTQCLLKQLCIDNMRFQDFTINSIESINSNITSLKNQIIAQETSQIVINIGNLISKIYVNLDVGKVSDYSNELTGKLLHPYECTNSILVGQYECIDKTSIPSLSLNSLEKRTVYSNTKKYFLLKKLCSSNVYISQYMNSTQIISKMFEIQKHVMNCMCFHTFYNEFKSSDSEIGLFPFEISNSSIILAFNKSTEVCHYYSFGDIDFMLDIKLTSIIELLEYDVVKQYHSSNNEEKILMGLYYLIKNELSVMDITQEIIIESDNNFIEELPDTEYENVNHILYTSIIRALMLLKVKQYTPESIEDDKYIKISDNEMNQIFSIGHILQKNIQCVNMLKNEKFFTNLQTKYFQAKKNLIDEIKTKFVADVNIELEKLTDIFLNGSFLEITKSISFDTEITVTEQALSWWHGSRSVGNDRGVGAGTWAVVTFNPDGIFTNYENAVKESARNFKSLHLKYIEECKTQLRTNKIFPEMKIQDSAYMSNTINYKNEYTHQLPFFIYPDEQTRTKIVLPLFESLRKKLMEITKNTSYFIICTELILNGIGMYKVFYKIINNIFTLIFYIQINDNILEKIKNLPYSNDEPYKTVIANMQSKLITLATVDIPDYTTVFNSVTLDTNKTDSIWTWFCGGITGSGQTYHQYENSHTHIPGNWSCAGVQVPTWSKRPSVINDTTKLKYNEINNHTALGLLEAIKNPMLDNRFNGVKKNMFTLTTDNPVYSKLDEYFATVRAIETFDYFTWNKMEKNDIRIRNELDINTKILNNNDVILCKDICVAFVETSFDTIKSEYDEASFIGDNTLVGCLKDLTQITEIFGSYITKGLSTPEIVKSMIGHINKLYTTHKQLLNDINRTNNFYGEEKTNELNRIVQQYTENLNNMSNPNNLLC